MNSGVVHKLVLERLSLGLPGITPAYAQTMVEAAAVRFQEHNHPLGVELRVFGTREATFGIFWPEVTEQMLQCWNDREFTTEQAAYGVAALLVLELTNYTVIRRSRKGTGFDYWLGLKESEDELPFQNKARLEVSGIRSGGESDVNERERIKLSQVTRSDSTSLPAIIVVIEFSTPMSKVTEK